MGGGLHRAYAALLVGAISGGCGVDLETDPAAHVTCASNAQCPDSYICNRSSGRCILAAAEDSVSPSLLGAPTLDPAIAGASGNVSFSFRVSEPLLIDPVVTFVNGGGTRSLAHTSNDGAEEPSYVYTYAVAGDEDEVVSPLRLRLIDRAGNTTDDETGLSITFDRTAPGIVGGAVMRLVPPEGGFLDEVEAAARQTIIEITITVDELLATLPELTTPAGDFAFACTGDETVYTCVGEVPGVGDVSDGPTTVSVYLEDLAGNTVTRTLTTSATMWPDGLVIDTTAPAVPSVTSPGSVVFHRNPWGTGSSSGLRQMTLRGYCADTGGTRARATDPDTWIFVYDDADPATAGLLGVVRADAAGAFGLTAGGATACGSTSAPFDLNPIDLPTVYVLAVDGAGNASDGDPAVPGAQAAAVRDIEWTATLGKKIAGSDLENPHTFETWRWFAPQRQTANGGLAGEQQGLAEAGGQRVVTMGASRWQNATPTFEGLLTSLDRSPTLDVATSYDPIRGRMVRFGGYSPCSCGGLCALTIERDGVRWMTVSPRDPEGDGNPSARRGAALAFDFRAGVTVLFGGLGAARLGDTWTYDGRSWQQRCTDVVCSTGAPEARDGHTLVADPVTGSVLLVGGETAAGTTNDIWRWAGTSWQRLCDDETCSSNSPTARRDHAMVYLPDDDAFLLFGGSDGGDELWRWDREQWTQLCTDDACRATAPPATRDPGFVVWGLPTVVGGEQSGLEYSYCGEDPLGMWSWDGSKWSPVETTGVIPRARYGHSAVTDVRRDRIVLVGGEIELNCGTSAGCDPVDIFDAWEWDGERWTSAWPEGPAWAEGAAATWDPARQGVFVHGGKKGSSFTYYGYELWKWAGAGWRGISLEPPPNAPKGRAYHGMAVDPATGDLIVYGGSDASGPIDDDVWGWDGSSWNALCGSTCEKPTLAAGAALVTIPEGVLYVGQDGFQYDDFDPLPTETWLWTKGGWSLPCASPGCKGTPAAGLRPAVLDPTSGLVWLLGGSIAFEDPDNALWTFGGTSWSLARDATSEPTSPEGRLGSMAAWDAGRQRAVLFGGSADNLGTGAAELCRDGFALCGGMWLWDGSSWSQPALADPLDDGEPLPRKHAAFVYDAARDTVVMHGGDRIGRLKETWLWHGGATERPAHVFTARLDVASFDQSAMLLDIEVRWIAGGSGQEGTEPVDGARAYLWDVDHWQPLATTNAAADAPGELLWLASTDPGLGALMGTARAHRLTAGPTRSLVFALAPLATNGSLPQYATVSSDYVEVLVRYRR